jgi:formylglycine-generating enzyme required for sulfatase activity
MKSDADGYRLPAEAEWEYAARGGDQAAAAQWGYTYAGTSASGTGSGELGDYAWYDANAFLSGSTSDPDYGAHPVGAKNPNKTGGLYDMSGNVWEWCWDWYSPGIDNSTPAVGPASGSYRVARGGSWDGFAAGCAAACRGGYYPGGRSDDVGFRVVSP